jgi:hypothetical protein
MNSEVGPLTPAELREMASKGQITPLDQIRKDGSDQWVKASQLKGLFQPATTSDTPEQAKPPGNQPPEIRTDTDDSRGNAKSKQCPFCKETILAEAIKCKHCGEFLNEKPAKKNTMLLELAENQRYVLYTFLGELVALVMLVAAPPIGFFFILAAICIRAFFVFKLSVLAFDEGTGMVFGVLSLLPLIGIFFLLGINQTASSILKQCNLPVGLLGVPTSVIEELRKQQQG